MVALARSLWNWRDPAEAPRDGTMIYAEDEDGQPAIVEWRNDAWVMADLGDGNYVTLTKPIVRWRALS